MTGKRAALVLAVGLAAAAMLVLWRGGAGRRPGGGRPRAVSGDGGGGGAGPQGSPSRDARLAPPSLSGPSPPSPSPAGPGFTEVLPPRAPAETEVLVAAIQFASRMGAVEENRRGLLRMVRRAAGRGAKLIALPETAVQGYASRDHRTVWARPEFPNITTEKSLAGFAETVPGESTRAFGEVSKEFGCYVSVPVAEHDPVARKYFNTVVVMGPDGAVACHYRKLRPWTVMEYAWSSPGDRGCGVIDTPYGRVGVMICFDIHSVLGMLSERGVDTVLYSVAWVDHRPGAWFDERLPDLCRDRAVALVLANWTAPAEHGSSRGFGYSRIISARGEVVARASREHGDEIVYGVLPRGGARGR